MKLTVLVSLFLLVSCASKRPVAERTVAASQSELPAFIDFTKSSVKLFPPILDGDKYRYYFYVDLKDEAGVHADCAVEDITLKNESGKSLNFRLDRLLIGRYYVVVDGYEKIHASTLSVYLRGQKLKGDFKLSAQKPVLEHSSVRLIKNEDYTAKLVMQLRDENGRPVSLAHDPELILNGDGQIYGLRQVKEGVWEFSLHYSEQNHIMYISVRAQGVYFRNIFRFQHVEKYP